MRFIGGKSLILPYILKMISSIDTKISTISDLFSGSGIVTRELKKHGYNTISNDLMYFSYVLLRGTVSLDKEPKFITLKEVKIEDPIDYLNNITIDKTSFKEDELFVYNNYSPKGNRYYFSEKNAIKIDLIRLLLNKWKNKELVNEDEYYYLLCSLIEAIPYISNTTGIYGAFLKHWDKRALKDLKLIRPELSNNDYKSIVYNEDTNNIINKIKSDVSYFDPPYNHRQYLANYHILETIAKYDNPKIKGITGIREYEKSKYCLKNEAKEAFEDLIRKTKSKYIILSYNSEGILNNKDIIDIMSTYAIDDIKIENIDYLRYKNSKTKSNKNLKESLYFMQRWP